MPSSSLHVGKRRRTYLRLLSEITHAINRALVEEFRARGLTQTQMAKTLGVDKSFISKKLSGEGNMTLETLADLAFALDRPVMVQLPSRHPMRMSNQRFKNYDTLDVSSRTDVPQTGTSKSDDHRLAA